MSARHWIGTLFTWSVPEQLPVDCAWLRGQQETCPSSNRVHWQLLASFRKPQRLSGVKRLIGEGHWEQTRSEAAIDYVWKEHTAVVGTRFELGRRLLRRNNSTDWGEVLDAAKRGVFEDIPADITIRYYRSLKQISSDFEVPIGTEKVVNVYYGATGTGKSRRAWDEAGLEAYSKDPRTKWWDGYQGQSNVIIDEFRGAIDISHILRWLDRYPVRVERKGGSMALRARTFWITSNLPPLSWYSELDEPTKEALQRRLTNIIEF